jgi:tetratricopeptide (TPR) repeat protein
VAVEKARAQDPEAAEAHLARGLLTWTPANRFPHEKAIQIYGHAIELNPDLDEAHHQLGLVYMHVGLLDRGHRRVSQGRGSQSWQYLGPQSRTGFATIQLGRVREAETFLAGQLQKDARDRGGVVHGALALAYAASGRRREAEEAIRKAQELGRGFGHFHHTAYMIALAYARMDRAEPALRLLEQAASEGYPCYPAFANDPQLNPIRKDPRFIEFLARQKEQFDRWRKMFGD